MGYNREEKKEVRFAFLRMFLRLSQRLDDARLALIMSVADLYFEPDLDEDHAILQKLSIEFPTEGAAVMELMPAWKRWGYEEGMEEGIEKGIEEGIETGIAAGREQERLKVMRKLLDKGFSLEEVAETIDCSTDEAKKLLKRL